jgi:hypothetical protein
MTRKDWEGWQEMLKHVPGHSQRAIGLFGVACCRAVWHLLTDERSRRAVEVAERYAEGQASSAEFSEASRRAYQARDATHISEEAETTATEHDFDVSAAHRAVSYLTETGFRCIGEVGEFVRRPASDGQRHEYPSPLLMELQCNLLREIFGNPFRPLLPEPNWRSPGVLQLAQTAYDDRSLPAGTLDSARLAVLADAVEEAGCTDAELLGHLRSPGPHVHGCWAVDAVLGKS